jgi:hypothetical protein
MARDEVLKVTNIAAIGLDSLGRQAAFSGQMTKKRRADRVRLYVGDGSHAATVRQERK